ncbi:MAG: class I SAM-dependent methyltransferase [Kofleriaceae bacterium]
MTSFEELVRSLVDAGSREHYLDADLYDYEYRRRRSDLAFYRALAMRVAPGRPILDLGAGTGRLTLPLARDGHRVVALDQAPAMLARLRARLALAPPAVTARVEARAGDLRAFRLGRRFGLVVAAFNVVEHLYTRQDMAAFLARVSAHLEPGGTLAFDVQMPDLQWLARDPRRRWSRTKFTHPTSGERLVYSTNHDYDPVTQIALIRIYYEPVAGGPTRIVKLSQRKFFPAELEALLAAGGFRLEERYGDFDGAPLDDRAQSQVVVCRRATGGRRRGSAGASTGARPPARRPARGASNAAKQGLAKKKVAPVEKKTTSRRR